MDKLNEIKEKIHTVNPSITDELLDLLYEYIKERNYLIMSSVKDDTAFQELVLSIARRKI